MTDGTSLLDLRCQPRWHVYGKREDGTNIWIETGGDYTDILGGFTSEGNATVWLNSAAGQEVIAQSNLTNVEVKLAQWIFGTEPEPVAL